MNEKLVTALTKNLHDIDPPGCVSDFVEHPNRLYADSRSVEVGLVMEHRFAFSYWIKCKQEIQAARGGAKIADADFMAPDLVTWDWHDDCGADSDVNHEQLAMLNQADEEEVAFYCWAGLSSLNDGQTLPALWLGALGNVYIVQKEKQDCKHENRRFTDRYGRDHRIFYFRTLKDFAKTFAETNSGTGVVWDVDMDYFTSGREVADQWYTPALSAEAIRELLSPTSAWMPWILRDLRAITIALEPKYTGGLNVSLELYRHWESALFAAPLFNKQCRWKKGILRD